VKVGAKVGADEDEWLFWRENVGGVEAEDAQSRVCRVVPAKVISQYTITELMSGVEWYQGPPEHPGVMLLHVMYIIAELLGLTVHASKQDGS
jgi:hypothetical protein